MRLKLHERLTYKYPDSILAWALVGILGIFVLYQIILQEVRITWLETDDIVMYRLQSRVRFLEDEVRDLQFPRPETPVLGRR